MRLTRALNLLIPLPVDADDAKGEPAGTIYIHSTPIPREVFNDHFEVLTATYSAIWEKGFGYQGAARSAYLQLRKIAKDMKVEAQIEREVIGEIRRLTMVAIPGKSGYEQILLEDAEKRDIFSADDLDEIMGLVCFFTLEVSMHRRPMAEQMMTLVGGMWGSQTTALDFTAFLSSLATSTAAVNSGAAASESPTAAPVASTAFPLR